MSTSRKQVLRLVPKPEGTIDADMVAFTIMEYIDQTYPVLWKGLPKTARVNVRNTIVRAVKEQERRP